MYSNGARGVTWVHTSSYKLLAVSRTLTRNVEDLQLPVTQTEHVPLLQTRDVGWLDAVAACTPVPGLGCDLLT